MNTTTPRKVSEPIQLLCRRINPNAEPTYVSVHLEEWSVELDCFNNVERKVADSGGAVAYGWVIWEWPGVLAEAEFHANWLSPDGKLVDVTPKPDGEQQILFLSDPSRRWEGKFVDNIRQAISNTGLVRDLEWVGARLVHEQNKGLKSAAGVLMDGRRFLALQEVKMAIGQLLEGGGDENSPCPCNGGRRYKNCHRKLLTR